MYLTNPFQNFGLFLKLWQKYPMCSLLSSGNSSTHSSRLASRNTCSSFTRSSACWTASCFLAFRDMKMEGFFLVLFLLVFLAAAEDSTSAVAWENWERASSSSEWSSTPSEISEGVDDHSDEDDARSQFSHATADVESSAAARNTNKNNTKKKPSIFMSRKAKKQLAVQQAELRVKEEQVFLDAKREEWVEEFPEDKREHIGYFCHNLRNNPKFWKGLVKYM
mmetsp:Transcript_5406/g.17097  ORF Transcript_5406/g.17097 Transcript_5406/m.17097 type:complete len:222 (+) Transcript_5406:121-786(+)